MDALPACLVLTERCVQLFSEGQTQDLVLALNKSWIDLSEGQRNMKMEQGLSGHGMVVFSLFYVDSWGNPRMQGFKPAPQSTLKPWWISTFIGLSA